MGTRPWLELPRPAVRPADPRVRSRPRRPGCRRANRWSSAATWAGPAPSRPTAPSPRAPTSAATISSRPSAARCSRATSAPAGRAPGARPCSARGATARQVGGRYSNGLLDSVYKGFAGGVTQIVWHGYAYRDAPAGVGTTGRDGSWPGYHPWDIFGVISVNDEFGPRQASWPDYHNVNDVLARSQLVLRQGRSVVDLGSSTRRPNPALYRSAALPRDGLGHLRRGLHLRLSGSGVPVECVHGGRRLHGGCGRRQGDDPEQPGHPSRRGRPTPAGAGQAGPADLRRRRRSERDPRVPTRTAISSPGIVASLLAQPTVTASPRGRASRRSGGRRSPADGPRHVRFRTRTRSRQAEAASPTTSPTTARRPWSCRTSPSPAPAGRIASTPGPA